MYRGIDAARIILESQLEGIRRLKEKGIIVKVNTVVIPGINDGHVAEVARCIRAGGRYLNCIPALSCGRDALRGVLPAVGRDEWKRSRRRRRGLSAPDGPLRPLPGRRRGPDRRDAERGDHDLLKEAARPRSSERKPYVAVASMEGFFVNQHLGEAAALWIFGIKDGKAELIERRPSRLQPGGGPGAVEPSWRSRIADCNTRPGERHRPLSADCAHGAGRHQGRGHGRARRGRCGGGPREEEIPKILLRTAGRCGIGEQCTGTGTGCG